MCCAEMQHAGHKRSASEREATDEDFVIHCSQSYIRTASQSIQGSDASQACAPLPVCCMHMSACELGIYIHKLNKLQQCIVWVFKA